MLRLGLGCAIVVASTAATFAQDGEAIFRQQCASCHLLEEGRHRVGPSLHGIVGAPAGAVEGFRYSPALRASGLTWDPETLSAFLMDPRGTIPGNRMSYRGMDDQDDIDAVITYILERSN
ncbi:c-type cytochrome [Roseobacter sinensis]|uniref:Cytochrome c family protein n=1 Tax=Roseobacter sinensis TaxID=2931391 RepID=A0ABT3BA45_9RHOB|nr:cytochrome c family protein [Roseobacter sp. WL0113]MCV3270074.1 cytochrome c family protein [Roseobacter sp. WL0113]